MNSTDLEILFDVISMAQDTDVEVEIDQIDAVIGDLPEIEKARTFQDEKRTTNFQGVTLYMKNGDKYRLTLEKEYG